MECYRRTLAQALLEQEDVSMGLKGSRGAHCGTQPKNKEKGHDRSVFKTEQKLGLTL